jgi:hypothetical protein
MPWEYLDMFSFRMPLKVNGNKMTLVTIDQDAFEDHWPDEPTEIAWESVRPEIQFSLQGIANSIVAPTRLLEVDDSVRSCPMAWCNSGVMM